MSARRAWKCCSALSLRCCSFSFSLCLASSAWLALTSLSRSLRLASILSCFSFSFSLSAFSFWRLMQTSEQCYYIFSSTEYSLLFIFSVHSTLKATRGWCGPTCMCTVYVKRYIQHVCMLCNNGNMLDQYFKCFRLWEWNYDQRK